jgi:hypothetical protein
LDFTSYKKKVGDTTKENKMGEVWGQQGGGIREMGSEFWCEEPEGQTNL